MMFALDMLCKLGIEKSYFIGISKNKKYRFKKKIEIS